MKYFFPTLSFMILLLLNGCASIGFETPKEEMEQCQSPYVFISQPQIILDGSNDLKITQEQILQQLQNLTQNNCVAISSNPDAFAFKISYETQLTKKDKESITTKAQENTARIKVSFSLQKDRTTRTFNSERSLKINGKKVLGIGQKSEITEKDKQELLESVMAGAYKQASNALR